MKYNDCKISIWDTDKYMVVIDAMSEAYEGPRNVALDLGAHVGTRSIWLATDGGFDKVYAVEMEVENYRYLCGNILKNKLSDKITPVLAAVSDSTEIVKIKCGGINHGQYSICFDADNVEFEQNIITTPLYNILHLIEKPIDFCKMDIEGAEYRIFSSALNRSFISQDIRFLFLERHGPNSSYFSKSFFRRHGYDSEDPNRQLFEHLKSCGFENIKENAIGQLMMYNSRLK